jgi:aspartokinase-like uncharacterized kinase
MKLDAVIKIGGSLSRGTGLNALCRTITGLGKHHRLLIVPGGGEFADQVRDLGKRYSLNDTTSHHMALLAMDQYGYMLNQLIAESSLVADVYSVDKAVETGQAAILLPASLIMGIHTFPHSWEVTSDTIAAWISQKLDCPRLILLKDVDGILAIEKGQNHPTKLIPSMTVEELAGHTGGVDGYLARFLASTQLETWIINGSYPERLSELLKTKHTVGTRIESRAG